MATIDSIIIAVISSSTVLGIFVFFMKKYLEKLISFQFEKQTKEYSSQLSKTEKISEIFLERRLGIYPEISEVIYRLRNIMRDGLNREYAYEWNEDIVSLCAHLTENLYKYRLFLPKDIFKELHKFKQIAQDVMIFRDIHTRDDKIVDKEGYKRDLESIRGKVKQADELHNFIIKSISLKIKEAGSLNDI